MGAQGGHKIWLIVSRFSASLQHSPAAICASAHWGTHSDNARKTIGVLCTVEDAGRLSVHADEAQIKLLKPIMQQTTDQEVGDSNSPGRAIKSITYSLLGMRSPACGTLVAQFSWANQGPWRKITTHHDNLGRRRGLHPEARVQGRKGRLPRSGAVERATSADGDVHPKNRCPRLGEPGRVRNPGWPSFQYRSCQSAYGCRTDRFVRFGLLAPQGKPCCDPEGAAFLENWGTYGYRTSHLRSWRPAGPSSSNGRCEAAKPSVLQASIGTWQLCLMS